MKPKKYSFSKEEQKRASKHNFFITRETVLKKVEIAFADLLIQYENTILIKKSPFPNEIIIAKGKISKGERLEYCPWVALDYPRFFDKENIFLFRTLFWWGHYVSFNLILTGHYSTLFLENILKNHSVVKLKDYYLYTGNDAWENNLEEKKFKRVIEVRNLKKTIQESQSKSNLIKIVRKLEIKKWDRLIETGKESLADYLQLIQ